MIIPGSFKSKILPDTLINGQKCNIYKYQNSTADSLIVVYKNEFKQEKTFFYRNGTVHSKIFLDNYGDEKRSIYYYENGKKKTETTRKGRRGYKFRITEWDEHGKRSSRKYIE